MPTVHDAAGVYLGDDRAVALYQGAQRVARDVSNILANPAGVGGVAWSANSGVGTISEGPALGPFSTSARMTRVTTSATRVGCLTPYTASTAYRVRLLVRTSHTLTGVAVNLRPDWNSSTGQTSLGTVNLPAGETLVTVGGTSGTATPGGSAALVLIVGSGQGVVGTTVDVVGLLTPGTTDPGVIFNGATPRARWTGAAHQSPSVLWLAG